MEENKNVKAGLFEVICWVVAIVGGVFPMIAIVCD